MRRTVLLAAVLPLCLGCLVLDPEVKLADGGVVVSDGSFCGDLQASSEHLRDVLASCPANGDANIYAFNKDTCLAQAAGGCSAAEQHTLLAVAACQRGIAACHSPSDREAAVKAITACVPSDAMLSSECTKAIGN